MMNRSLVDETVFDMIEYFGDDVKQAEHALKVHGFASTIAGVEQLSDGDRIVTELAAILHDIGIEEAGHKHNSRGGHFQEIEGPPIARDILTRNGVPQETIERVCFIVGHHHTYDKIDNVDFRIVVESDFIVNISEGNLKNPDLREIEEDYFTTETGKRIFESLYLRKQSSAYSHQACGQ